MHSPQKWKKNMRVFMEEEEEEEKRECSGCIGKWWLCDFASDRGGGAIGTINPTRKNFQPSG